MRFSYFPIHAMAHTLTLPPIFYTLPKTLNPISPFHKSLPFSSSILSRQNPTRRSLSRSVLRSTAAEFSNSVDDEEESEELDELDVIALEQEAKDAARAYSSSLSQVLSIGEPFFFLIRFCFSLQWVFNNHLYVFWIQKTRRKVITRKQLNPAGEVHVEQNLLVYN